MCSGSLSWAVSKNLMLGMTGAIGSLYTTAPALATGSWLTPNWLPKHESQGTCLSARMSKMQGIPTRLASSILRKGMGVEDPWSEPSSNCTHV